MGDVTRAPALQGMELGIGSRLCTRPVRCRTWTLTHEHNWYSAAQQYHGVYSKFLHGDGFCVNCIPL